MDTRKLIESYKNSKTTIPQINSPSKVNSRTILKGFESGLITPTTKLSGNDINKWNKQVETISNKAYNYLSNTGYKKADPELLKSIEDLLSQSDDVRQYILYNRPRINDYQTVYDGFRTTEDYLKKLRDKVRDSNDYFSTFPDAKTYEESAKYLDTMQNTDTTKLAEEIKGLEAQSAMADEAIGTMEKLWVGATREDGGISENYRETSMFNTIYNEMLEQGHSEKEAYRLAEEEFQKRYAELNSKKGQGLAGYKTLDELNADISSKKKTLKEVTNYQEVMKLSKAAEDSTDFNKFSLKGAKTKEATDENGKKHKNKLLEAKENNESFFYVGGGMDYGQSKFTYKLFTEDEKKVYNYYFGKGDFETADRYWKVMKKSLNERYGKAIFNSIEGTPAEYLYFVPAGLDQFTTGIKNVFNFSDEYVPASPIAVGSSLVREDLGKKHGTLGTTLYDIGTTTVNMIPSIATGAAVGAAVGTVNPVLSAKISAVTTATLMGASAKGNAYVEKINAGWSVAEAQKYSTIVGVSEACLQYVLNGVSVGGGALTKHVTQNALNGIKNGFLKGLAKLGISMGSEAIEEGLQEILDPFYENFALGYAENGIEDIDWEQVAYNAVLGGISGALFEGGGTAANTVKLNMQYGRVYSPYAQEVVNGAREATKGGDGLVIVEKAQETLDSGKKLSGNTLRKLIVATNEGIAQSNVAKLSPVVSEQLMAHGEQGDVAAMADIISRASQGLETESSELKAIENSHAARTVFADIVKNESWVKDLGLQKASDLSYNQKIYGNKNAATAAMAEGQTTPAVEGEATAEAETVATETEAATDAIAHPAPTAGKVLKMTPVSAKAKNYVKDIAKRLGTNLEFVDIAAELAKRGKNIEGLVIYPEGFYDPKTHTLYVGNEVSNPVEFVFKHELTHYGERSKYYVKFARAVRDSKAFKKWLDTQATYTAKDTAGKELQLHLILKERYKKIENLTERKAQREVIANFVADVLFKGDVETLSEILNEATPTQKNAILRFLSDFFSWIKSKFTGSKQIVSEISDLENMFRELIGDAAVNPMPTEAGITYDTAETEANESVSVAEANTDSTGAELSKGQRKYFALSKVRDAYGRLLRLYHGTANGEFYTYDRSKGNVENDFGSAHYFTNNESDVTKNYEGGGPDFEAKVRRRANEIANERGIEYEQAEQMARKELFKGSNKHTVYVRMVNPAIVGETNLLDPQKYLEQTNNDYDAAKALAEKDISKIYWAVKRKLGVENVNELIDVLWNAVNQGGIGIEQLKSNIGKLRYTDNNGNRLGNEVTRQVIESLGYDGIIDPTVSSKWNMDMEEGTVHYIVFNSEQIKDVNNRKPTEDEDIRYSVPASTVYDDLSFSVPASEGEAQTNYKAELGRLLQRLQNEEITQEEYMSEVSKLYQKSVDENGQIKQGEMVTPENKPYPVPKKVKEGTAVRGFVRTVMETGKATPEIASHFEQIILSGEFDHTPTSNEKRINAAVQKINSLGYQQALDNWYKTNDKLLTSDKNNIAVGEALLNLAFEHKNVTDIMNLTAELAEIGTRTAQDLQAMKLLKRMGGIAQLVYVQKAVAKTNQNLEKRFSGRFERRGIPVPVVKINETMANQLAECSTESEYEVVYEAIMQDIANQVPSTFLDKFTAWRYMSMLFSTTTHISNFLGNAIFLPMVRMKNVIGKAIELTRPKDQRTKSVMVKKAYKDFAEKDFAEVKDLISGSGKYNPSDQINEYRKIFKTRWLEALRKFNFKALEKEDAFFLKRHYRHSLGGYLQAQGIDLNNISQKQLRKARDYAIQEALKATYRDTNKVANVLSQLSHTSVLGNVLIEGVMPFKKTPLNIVKRGIEYSPAGLLKTTLDGIRLLRGGTITASEWVDGLASNLTGIGVFLLGFWLSSMGIVKAGFDDEDERFRKMNGEQEYSIEILGHSYTMSWAAPMCIPFFMGSAMEEYDPDEDGDLLSAIGDIALSGFEPVLELSCLSGINDAIQGVKYAAEGEIPGLVMHSVKSFASQLLPTSLGKVANLFDDTRRTTYIDKTSDIPELAQEALDKLASKFPGATYTRAEYIDAWGREQYTGNVIERFFARFVSPGYASTIDPDPIYDELKAIKEATGEAGVYPKAPEKEITFGGVKRHLSKEEYYNVATMSGQTKMNLVNEAMDHKFYDKLTDEQKAEVIMNIYKYSNSLAITSELDFTLDEIKAGLGDKKGSVLTESRWNGFSFEQQQYLIHEAFMDGVITAYKYEQNGGSAAEYFILKALKNN